MISDEDAGKIVEAGRYVFATKENISALRGEMNRKFERLFEILISRESMRELLSNLSTKDDIEKLSRLLTSQRKEGSDKLKKPFPGIF